VTPTLDYLDVIMRSADPWDETEALERKMEIEILDALAELDDEQPTSPDPSTVRQEPARGLSRRRPITEPR